MSDLVVAIGLVLVIEGLLWSLFPGVGRKLLAVAAGDNVARLVPPLIVSEAEVADAIARLDRACTAIERKQQASRSTGAVA